MSPCIICIALHQDPQPRLSLALHTLGGGPFGGRLGLLGQVALVASVSV